MVVVAVAVVARKFRTEGWMDSRRTALGVQRKRERGERVVPAAGIMMREDDDDGRPVVGDDDRE